jgi:hypothetical protein
MKINFLYFSEVMAEFKLLLFLMEGGVAILKYD